jgi:hypothetical protein
MSKAAQVGITASRIPGLVGKALGPIIDGAGYGALNATGNDQNIATGAAIGAAGGALGKIVGPIASKLLAKAQQTLSSPQIKDAARAAYQKADGLGVVYAPEAVTGLTNDLKDQFAKFGYHPELQPGAKVALGELDRLAQNGNVNLTGLDTARKLASNAYIPGNKSNNALVSKVISGIDDMAANVGPANVVTGNAPEAAATLADARSLWGKSAKMDTVDFLKQKAENRAASTGSGGNVENATRQNLRQLLDNPAKARGFTPDELAQVKTVVGGTATQNILHQLGKFSPFGNGLTGAIEGTGALTAQMAGSPMVAALPLGAAAVGTASKYASEAIQRKSLETLTKMLATGKSASELAPSLSENQIKAIDMIKRALMAGGSAAAIEAQR